MTVVLEKFHVLGSGRADGAAPGGGEGGEARSYAPRASAAPKPAAPPAQENLDEDVPF
jgi:single-strand DNA-binding protein